MRKKVYGFPKVKYDKKMVNNLTDRQKQEYALEDEDIIIYDDMDSFLTDLNDNITPNGNEVIWVSSSL